QALPPQDHVEAWLSGEIREEHYFVGRQSVRVLRPRVQKPNGGERLQAGSFLQILWDLHEVGSADALTASYSMNGGSTWTTVGTVPPSQPLVWQVPGEVTDQGLLRVEASGEGVFLGYDVSDLPFSVVATTTGIEPGLDVPMTALFQNAPNPFSASTRIAYNLATPGEVRLEVFNLSGMRVRTLLEGYRPEGAHEASWDGHDDASRRMPSGIYIVRLRTPSADVSRRMLLVP
ncbi:MAG TPA: FlgD immunoglobulin-like domain containing protein, partial [Candidatus Eisenbacteria bacterium]|nr:FlgD immunoglobulin-like domain containing protein [Candidatus Eisenbacteria bacterium]